MTVKQSDGLIVKFITNQACQSEIELLTQWLENTENQKVFKEFVKTNYAVDYTMTTFNADETKQLLTQKIKQENSVFYKRKMKSFFKYAAVLVIVLGLTYLYQNDIFTQKDNILTPKEELITLQMADGSVQVINVSPLPIN